MKVTAALLASVVLGNRLLEPGLFSQGNLNPYLFGDNGDMAQFSWMQEHPDNPMIPYMMQKMDKEDWALYNMMQQQGQQGGQGSKAPGKRGQASSQVSPGMMQALMQTDIGQDLMDNDLVQAFMMAKQMQGQQQPSPGPRGSPKGFGDFAQFGGFGQTSTTPTTPQFQYYPGMDEDMMRWQMMQQMGQQQPGTYNPMMVDWDMKDWTQYNMMNQQGSQNSNSAMWMDGDMSDYMMWQSLMNSQNQNQKPSGPRGNAIEQMEKMALCMEYLKSLNGNQATQMQAYSLYANANDVGEDDIRDCLMMHQMQQASAAAAAPATPSFDFGSGFGSGFGPRTLPDAAKNMAMMAWMNKNQGGTGVTYYPGLDSEDIMEFNFWQKMKEQVASNKQQ